MDIAKYLSVVFTKFIFHVLIGCGKTRAVIELPSQHWGFYFNAVDDDWGIGDIQ